MGLFPKIQSPCPYKGPLSDILAADDVCRLCDRMVHDLTAMTDSERQAFLGACAGEVCVRYTLPMRPALAALAAGAAMLATPAMAQDATAPAEPDWLMVGDIIVGGMRAPQQAEWVEASEIASGPELPVVYEDEAMPGATTASVATTTPVASTAGVSAKPAA